MSTLQDLAECKKALGPVSMRNGDTAFTFASVSDILKAKEACAPLPRLCDLPGCEFQSASVHVCHCSSSRSYRSIG